MITFDDFKKLDLRVATITAAREHPDADRLMVLEIDLGEDAPRTIVAGIRASHDAEALLGRQIIVAANLEPVQLRGIESNGMLLAATDDDRVVLLQPEATTAPGAKVG